MLRQKLHAFIDGPKSSIPTLQPSIKPMSHTLYKVQFTLHPVLL